MNNLVALDLVFDAAKFTLTRKRKHKIWQCPCGHHQMSSSGSRHGGRGDQNARALIRRILRQCETCEKCKQEGKTA
jgi:hypothetical protein